MSSTQQSRAYRDEETLRELYWDEGMSLTDVADRLGCTSQTVRRWMKKHDIDRRPGKDKRPPRFHTHVSGYERWRHKSCGERYSVRVHRLLAVAEYGFDEVKNKDVHHENHIPWDNRIENISLVKHDDHGKMHRDDQISHDTQYRDREWLYEKYVEQNMSLKEIGDLCGCSGVTISKWKNRMDIKK